MCSQSSPVGEEKQRKRLTTKNEKKKKKKKTSRETTSKIASNLEPSRKIRSKTRKPKFLSLKLELNTSHDSPSKPSTANNNKRKKKPPKQKKHKPRNTTTFQFLTETLTENYQYDAVAAYLFHSAADSAISSIHDLLDTSSAAAAAEEDCRGRVLSTYDHQDHGSSVSSSLVRTAMRRGASEEVEAETEAAERWVSYSEVVEEVMSRSGTPRWSGNDDSGNVVGLPSLSLKLDYQQIMEAWSDKGPLYVDGEPPQTVPDLYGGGCASVGSGGVESLWVVPEMEEVEKLKRGRRDASLLRYKEKRQSRLFAKRIRYEVRKLNAEKRPRIKGRFVKRVDT